MAVLCGGVLDYSCGAHVLIIMIQRCRLVRVEYQRHVAVGVGSIEETGEIKKYFIKYTVRIPNDKH